MNFLLISIYLSFFVYRFVIFQLIPKYLFSRSALQSCWLRNAATLLLEESNTTDFSNERLNTTPITMLATKRNSTYYHVVMSIPILNTVIETAPVMPVTTTSHYKAGNKEPRNCRYFKVPLTLQFVFFW